MEEGTLKVGSKIILRTIPPGKVKNDTPHYGLKEHASVDVRSGFILATTLSPASASGPEEPPARREHDSPYLPYLTIASCHTKEPIGKVYADKGYYGHPNRAFLHMNGIADGLRLVERAYASERIMRRDTTTAKLTEREIQRNKKISKKRYIAAPGGIRRLTNVVANETHPNRRCKGTDIDISIPRGKKQYFGLSHLHDGRRLVEPLARREHTGRGSPRFSKTSGIPCAGRPAL
jgi:hypothetical protein